MCSASADTEYTIIPTKKIQDLKISKTVKLYYNVVFIFECFHGEKHAQWHERSPQKCRTRKSPDGQNIFSFFFFFLFLLLLLLQNYMSISHEHITPTSAPAPRLFTRRSGPVTFFFFFFL